VAVIGTTVLLSVFTHGLSAKPLARRYAASLARPPVLPAEGAAAPHLPVRSLVHRRPDA
jgi:hypothetical protein